MADDIITITYGNRILHVHLLRSSRKTLGISVEPTGRVVVTAPTERSLEQISYFVRRRASWITRKQRYFSKMHPLPSEPSYASGSTHVYLGRQYRLKVVSSSEKSVKLKGRYIWVWTPDKLDDKGIEKQVQDWYLGRAHEVLPKRITKVEETVRHVELPVPVIRIRTMMKRWGSCTKAGTITLNVELVKTPVHCIDYIIAHELCHLIHKNHSSAFWRLLSRLMPDWEARKERLERVQI